MSDEASLMLGHSSLPSQFHGAHARPEVVRPLYGWSCRGVESRGKSLPRSMLLA